MVLWAGRLSCRRALAVRRFLGPAAAQVIDFRAIILNKMKKQADTICNVKKGELPMKLAKRISIFFIIPVGMYSLGFYSHMKLEEEFYPGKYRRIQAEETVGAEEAAGNASVQPEENVTAQPQVIAASAEDSQVISADTQYIIQEVDLRRDTSVETQWKVPDKYIGMDRKSFLREMELYQQSPSLKDQQLGFVSVEVISFSKSKVVVRKSYMFKEVYTSFYLVNEKNYVVVYCDDLKTVYMNTNISLDSLPDKLKQEIIQNKYIATEEELYNFLESYSS